MAHASLKSSAIAVDVGPDATKRRRMSLPSGSIRPLKKRQLVAYRDCDDIYPSLITSHGSIGTLNTSLLGSEYMEEERDTNSSDTKFKDEPIMSNSVPIYDAINNKSFVPFDRPSLFAPNILMLQQKMLNG